MIAEAVKIESDEFGFRLIVSAQEGEFDFNVQACAVELLNEVQNEIGPWYAESEGVREEYMRSRVFKCSPSDVDESGDIRSVVAGHQEVQGYYDSDPKHPDYHSVHADLYDNRDKGGRCV